MCTKKIYLLHKFTFINGNFLIKILRLKKNNFLEIQKLLYYDYKTHIHNFSRRYLPMAYVISDECVSCGACAAECPAEAISEGDEHYVIDADACLDCGTCADTCPTGAISEG